MKHQNQKIRKRSRAQGTVPAKARDLDRFAGSSDEEEDDGLQGQGDSDEVEGDSNAERKETLEADVESDTGGSGDDEADSMNEEEPQKLGMFHVDPSTRSKRPRDGHSENDRDSNKASHRDDDSVEEAAATMASTGMAAAMSRILGTGSDRKSTAAALDSKKSPVLSKTKTPLQRQAEQEKKEEREMRERRRINREKHLQALHIPLSVATTRGVATVGAGTALSTELEQERLLRRVATRGVVALFNAISQHQREGREGSEAAKQKVPSTSKVGKSTVAKMTKDGFLDLIKSKASQVKEKPRTEVQTHEQAPVWNALRDDYMMDSKKNWDEDDDNDNDEADSKWTDDDESSGHGDKADAARIRSKKSKVR